MGTDLDALRNLAAAATRGPWFDPGNGYVEGGTRHIADVRYRNGDADRALIVAAVNALPGLLDEVEGLRKLREAAIAREVAEEASADANTAYNTSQRPTETRIAVGLDQRETERAEAILALRAVLDELTGIA